MIGAVGVGDVTPCLEMLEGAPGVESAVRISAPLQVCEPRIQARSAHASGVNGAEIGGNEFIVMAGPCSVESEKQIMETAEGGGRGGRTSAARRRLQAAHLALRLPGPGAEGLKLLAKARAGHRPGHRHRSH